MAWELLLTKVTLITAQEDGSVGTKSKWTNTWCGHAQSITSLGQNYNNIEYYFVYSINKIFNVIEVLCIMSFAMEQVKF